MRVSNLQTASFSGPLGSERGTHRHRADGLVVHTETPTMLLWAPSAGRIDVTISASRDPGCMTAVWLVGTEQRDPRDSGEICLLEADADAIGTTCSRVRAGVKAHHDPRLAADMAELEVAIDAGEPHTWTAIWGAEGVVLGVDGRVLRRIVQVLGYPLMLLVDLFEFDAPERTSPTTALVHRVRGWSEPASLRYRTRMSA